MTKTFERALMLCAVTVALLLGWAILFGQENGLSLLCLCALMCGLVLVIDGHLFTSEKRQLPARTKPQQIRDCLRQRLGDETFISWFNALEFEGFDGTTITMSVPVKFLSNWIHAHYHEELTACCLAAFPEGKYARVISRSVPRAEQ